MRVRETSSLSLLARFVLAVAVASAGGACCPSCEAEKRLRDLERSVAVLLIGGGGGGQRGAFGASGGEHGVRT